MAQLNVIKILFLCAFSAVLAVAWVTPLSRLLYKHKLWRKKARDRAIDGKPAPIFYRLHKAKEVGIPRMGGLLIWFTTVLVIFLFAFLAKLFPASEIFAHLNFLSRSQTWLPLGILLAASFLGLADDLLQIFGKGKYTAGGIKFTRRLLLVFLIGAIGAWWFYFKLGWETIHIPGNGDFFIGMLYIPLFITTVIATWAGGIIDGIDGLSGGVFGIMFGAFTIIAFANQQYDLAAFCAVIAGANLAFLWFNIPPARFYMGETGTIGLTAVLAAVAFLTNSVVVLPIIGGLLVLEAGSAIIQLFSKKFLGRKVFLCAPIHHHLEAKGWPRSKITMRFWILSLVLAIIGTAIRLLG